MEFGNHPVSECVGAILAHSLAVGGQRFKKGRKLTADDVAALGAAGYERVTVAMLADSDVPEDEAANRLAGVLASHGLKRNEAFTGRANLYAEEAGVLVIDRARLDTMNLVDEAVTVATLQPYTLVTGGQFAATVKIIPFAAPRAVVDRVIALAGDGGPVLRVAPLRERKVGLVMTRLPDTRDKVLDKTRQVLDQRLNPLGSMVAAEERVAHDETAVAEAVRRVSAAGVDMVFVYGASAIVDRRDVVPAGIVAAGGRIDHFGMPVDPGNLLLVGRIGAMPAVGLPGCARSPKFNGFDWVLERLLAGLPVRAEDIMQMGAGGLLKEIGSRPQLREQPGGSEAHTPRIAGLLLAAGQSRRMGAVNKLLAEIDGRAMVAHVAAALGKSAAQPIVAVVGHEAAAVRAALAPYDPKIVENTDYAEGLSTSLRAGLAALPRDIDGVVVCLGDMPRITARHIDKLIAAFDPDEGRRICVPTWRGKRGNPVLWSADYFLEMMALGGDVGAKHLMGEHEASVVEVACDDDAVLADIDTPTALGEHIGKQ